MATLYLITGGSRSGKSAHAQSVAENLSQNRTYIATCPHIKNDEEMAKRINRHQKERANKGWQTIEEPLKLEHAFAQASPQGVLLVDCLTLWVNNLMYKAEQESQMFGEDEMARATKNMLQAARSYQGNVIFVSNEVGLGIIPDNSMARTFRDCNGRCNQLVAAAADKVTFMVSGLPMDLTRVMP